MIRSLDHIVLTVADVETSAAFYARVLGMQIVRFGQGRVAVAFGSQKINLHPMGKSDLLVARQPTPGSGDLCLLTDIPIAEVVVHLQQAQIDLLSAPVERTGAASILLSVYFADPDGNLIEVSNVIA